MKKKILLILAAVALLTSFSICHASTALSLKSEDEIISVIKLLEIANGDENGNMMLDSDVTRAQFVKMAVSASASKQTAQDTKLNVSLFPDVKNSFWGAGYISVAIKNRLVTGYLDGTFRPDNKVKLEEAVTIVLKLLGYTENEVMGSYPSSQIAKYRSLGLDTGIGAKVGETLKRNDCIKLLYNAMSVKAKSGSIYCTTLGYKTDAEGIIDYNSLVESKLKGPYVISEEKSVYLSKLIGSSYSEYTFYKDGMISSYDEINKYDALYFAKEINTAWLYSEKLFGVVQNVLPDAINPSSAVISSNTVNIAVGATGTKELREDAYVMAIYDRAGNVCAFFKANADMYNSFHNPDGDYLDNLASTVTSPYVVENVNTWKNDCNFNIDKSTVYLLEGRNVDEYSVAVNDVIYFSEAFNTLLIYRKTATGVVKSVTLQNNIPTAVNFTNKSYALTTNNIKSKFVFHSEYNKENTFVTLLLGMNDDAVDAIDGDMSKISANSDNASYVEMVEYTLEGPYLVTQTNNLSALPFDLAEADIIYNGNRITADSLRVNDIYYYSELVKSVLIYRDTVSGTIEDISTTAAPTSVTVAGKVYSIENQEIAYNFSSFGKYKVGETITLLLGKSGIAGAIKPDEDTTSVIYGVVTAKGEKEFKRADGSTYTGEYITITDTLANTHTYECDNKYFGIGFVVRVVVGNKISVTRQSTDIGSSAASRVAKAISNGDFTDDCQIIDIYNGNVKRIFPERISGIEYNITELVYSGGIKFYKFNDENKLEVLILGDLTGDLHEYGVVTSGTGGTIKYITDGAEKRYSTDNTIEEGPAVIRTALNEVTSIVPLRAYIDIDILANTTAIDEDGNEFKLADNIRVFIEKDDKYTVSSIDEVKNGNYNLRAYYDRKASTGGRIRVIIARRTV